MPKSIGDFNSVFFIGVAGVGMSAIAQYLAGEIPEDVFRVMRLNNGIYGTIRMHQEQRLPARTLGTTLTNPDFAAYARAFGAHGAVVERTEEFAPAFEAALAAGRPALLELRIDPEAISPRTTLSALRG